MGRLITNATIVTMDPARPLASTLLTEGGVIRAVGGPEVRALAPAGGEVIDAKGALVLPGFQDAHVHLLSGGIDLANSALLADARTLPDLLGCLRDHAARRPDLAVLYGSGWEPGPFGAHNLTAAAIDPVTGDRPAVLWDSSGHSAVLNSAALRLAGITRETPDPPNGEIVRVRGKATGMLQEDAINWAVARLPTLSDDDCLKGLLAGMAHANAQGITGIIDPKVAEFERGLYARAEADDLLTLRVAGAGWVTERDSPASALARLTDWRRRHPGPDFHLQSAKVFMDGVFENGTAACLLPTSDGKNADPMFTDRRTRNLFTALDAARFQIHVHAIGDAALRRALDGLEAARGSNGDWPALHQITHLQLVDPADAPRLAKLGAMANIQPLWAREDPSIPDIALDLIGEGRRKQVYPFRTLRDHGTRLCLSSDWPVSTLNPFEIIETAVTRQARVKDGAKPPFLPEQALTVQDCIAGYTVNAAAACWRAGFSGQLTPGYSADLILLDRDIRRCPASSISDTRVLLTLFKGRVVHAAHSP